MNALKTLQAPKEMLSMKMLQSESSRVHAAHPPHNQTPQYATDVSPVRARHALLHTKYKRHTTLTHVIAYTVIEAVRPTLKVKMSRENSGFTKYKIPLK